MKLYVSNIQGSGGSKLPELSARTSDSDFIICNESNVRKGSENIIGLNCKAVVISDGGETEKALAYGTVVSSKKFDPETDSVVYCSKTREIASIRVMIAEGCYATIIGMYCSPNDTAQQVRDFFEQLDVQLNDAVVSRRDSIVLLAGDSNSDVGTQRHQMLMNLCSKYNGRSLVNQPTRGNAQLDYVLAFYDPLLFSVNATVVPGVGDHAAIITEFMSQSVSELKESWTQREVVIDRGKYDDIYDALKDRLSYFDHSLLDSNQPFHIDPDQGMLDFFYEDLISTVEQTIREHRLYKVISLPEHKHLPIKSCETRKVQYCMNLIVRAARKLKSDPVNPSLVEKLEKARSNYTAACTVASKAIVEKDIEKKRKYRNSDPSRFFKA